MDILNSQNLRREADRTLKRGREPKKAVFVYAAVSLALSLISTLLSYWFGSQISDRGGLSNLGTRAIYETAQSVTPMIASYVAMCLELGFLGAMMRISRGQYADHTDLKVGFRKFWPLLRLVLIQSCIYFAVAFVSAQLGSMLFLMTPWAEPLTEVLAPMVASGTVVMDEATMMQAMQYMGPMFAVVGVVFLAGLIPVLHRLRMANFCLLDDPQGSAMAAVRTSSRMMRRRFLPMLKVDLSLWVYYLATAAVMLVMNLDLILGFMGIPLPENALVVSFGLYAVALVMQFAVTVLLRPRVELTYLAAYEKLLEKPKSSGVVLGNIFDM